PNTQIYILDSAMQICPIGVFGEIYLGGVQLSKGYLQRPDLTSEMFVPNPFFDPAVGFSPSSASSAPSGSALAPSSAAAASAGLAASSAATSASSSYLQHGTGLGGWVDLHIGMQTQSGASRFGGSALSVPSATNSGSFFTAGLPSSGSVPGAGGAA